MKEISEIDKNCRLIKDRFFFGRITKAGKIYGI
jgi:hypothetical protein